MASPVSDASLSEVSEVSDIELPTVSDFGPREEFRAQALGTEPPAKRVKGPGRFFLFGGDAGDDAGEGSSITKAVDNWGRAEAFDPAAEQTTHKDAKLTGLDTRCNPLKSGFNSGSDKELVKAVEIVRDVDWRAGKGLKPCATSSRLQACLVQQAGEGAPDGEACDHCNDGKGPFASCRVLAVDGRIPFDGACGNCGFNSAGIRCSLREGNGLVKWARDYVAKTNPHHRLVQEPSGTPVAKRTRSTKDKGKGPEKGKEKEKDGDGSKEKSSKAKGKEKKKMCFENKWFKNPLNDPAVQSTKNFAPAGEAYEALAEVIEEAEVARQILKTWLIKHGQLDESESSSSESEEEADSNPFGEEYKKRKRDLEDD